MEALVNGRDHEQLLSSDTYQSRNGWRARLAAGGARAGLLALTLLLLTLPAHSPQLQASSVTGTVGNAGTIVANSADPETEETGDLMMNDHKMTANSTSTRGLLTGELMMKDYKMAANSTSTSEMLTGDLTVESNEVDANSILTSAVMTGDLTVESHEMDANSTSTSALLTGNLTVDNSSSTSALLIGDLMVEGYKKAHPELCPALGTKIKVLILVMSAPDNFEVRAAIRSTWGQFATRKHVVLGFVIGEPAPAHRQQVDEEDALHGDIIEGNFVDSYKNLTLKTLSLLEWAETHCPRARTLLKTDDDVFVNVPLLIQFLKDKRKTTNTIWGKVARNSLPKRDPQSKYYLSPAQYPAEVLPEFATGPAYLVTRDVVPKLRAAAPSEKYLYLEDVFFTGILASRLNISRSSCPLFYNNFNKIKFGPCLPLRAGVLHRVAAEDQTTLWMTLNNTERCCELLRAQPPRRSAGSQRPSLLIAKFRC